MNQAVFICQNELIFYSIPFQLCHHFTAVCGISFRRNMVTILFTTISDDIHNKLKTIFLCIQRL